MHPNKEWLFLISTEKALRQFQCQMWAEFKSAIKPNTEVKLLRKLDTKSDENVTCLQMNKSGRLICIGTNKGSIRIYLLPEGTHKDYRAHANSITKLCFTFNDDYLVTASEDGTIIYWHINEKIRKLRINHQFNEEILIDQSSYLKTASTIAKNENKISDCRIETDFLYSFKELYSSIKQRELSNRLNQQLTELNNKIDSVCTNEETYENEFDSSLRKLKHDRLDKIQYSDNVYAKKIAFENEKNIKLMQNILELEDHLKVNELTLRSLQANCESTQLEQMEDKLKEAKRNFLQKFNFFDEKIKSLIDYESDFKDECENEKFQLNFDFSEKLSELKSTNSELQRELSISFNEIRLLEESISELNKRSIKSDIRIQKIAQTFKELDLLELKLKSDLESKDKCLADIENRYRAVNNDCDTIEVENRVRENKLEIEFKSVSHEHRNMLLIKNDIETEIKHKNLELSILKSQVNNLRFRRKKKQNKKIL